VPAVGCLNFRPRLLDRWLLLETPVSSHVHWLISQKPPRSPESVPDPAN
jgi:hypothetical protein